MPLSPVAPTPKTPEAANATYELIARLLDDVAEMFPDRSVHLGGDEVHTVCWNTTAKVASWLAANGLSEHEALVEFLQTVHAMATARGRRVTFWDEVSRLRASAKQPWSAPAVLTVISSLHA
eukprot:1697432-Rhodomonas_salina.3